MLRDESQQLVQNQRQQNSLENTQFVYPSSTQPVDAGFAPLTTVHSSQGSEIQSPSQQLSLPSTSTSIASSPPIRQSYHSPQSSQRSPQRSPPNFDFPSPSPSTTSLSPSTMSLSSNLLSTTPTPLNFTSSGRISPQSHHRREAERQYQNAKARYLRKKWLSFEINDKKRACMPQPEVPFYSNQDVWDRLHVYYAFDAVLPGRGKQEKFTNELRNHLLTFGSKMEYLQEKYYSMISKFSQAKPQLEDEILYRRLMCDKVEKEIEAIKEERNRLYNPPEQLVSMGAPQPYRTPASNPFMSLPLQQGGAFPIVWPE